MKVWDALFFRRRSTAAGGAAEKQKKKAAKSKRKTGDDDATAVLLVNPLFAAQLAPASPSVAASLLQQSQHQTAPSLRAIFKNESLQRALEETASILPTPSEPVKSAPVLPIAVSTSSPFSISRIDQNDSLEALRREMQAVRLDCDRLLSAHGVALNSPPPPPSLPSTQTQSLMMMSQVQQQQQKPPVPKIVLVDTTTSSAYQTGGDSCGSAGNGNPGENDAPLSGAFSVYDDLTRDEKATQHMPRFFFGTSAPGISTAQIMSTSTSKPPILVTPPCQKDPNWRLPEFRLPQFTFREILPPPPRADSLTTDLSDDTDFVAGTSGCKNVGDEAEKAGDEEIAYTWKVKRRPDGSRYAVRRPLKSSILRKREAQLARERIAITTDDDQTSDLAMGRYATRQERRRQLERERARKIQRQQLVIEATRKNATDQVLQELRARKTDRLKSRFVLDGFVTTRELLQLPSSAPNALTKDHLLASSSVAAEPAKLCTVTTV